MRVGEKVVEGKPGISLQEASRNGADFGVAWNLPRNIDRNVYGWLGSTDCENQILVLFFESQPLDPLIILAVYVEPRLVDVRITILIGLVRARQKSPRVESAAHLSDSWAN